MADPGTLAGQLPTGPDYVTRKLADLERQIRELGPSIAASFNTTVQQLNQAIASQISPTSDVEYAAGQVIPTTSTVQATATFAVPSGYTRAIVIATATAEALNGTSGGDYLYAKVVINGGAQYSSELYSAAQPGWSTSVSQPYNCTLTGLTAGSNVTVAAAVRSNTAAWPASGANLVTIYAQVLFLR